VLPGAQKRGEQNRRELAAVVTEIDLRFRRHVFRRFDVLLSSCHFILHRRYCILFCGKDVHLVNICLIAAKKSVTRPGSDHRACQWWSRTAAGIMHLPQAHNRDHEILTAPLSCKIVHACAFTNNTVAPYGRCAG